MCEVLTKICSKCHLEKPVTEFYKAKHHKDGLSSACKSCKRLYSQARKDITAKKNKDRYENKKEEISARAHSRYEENKQEISEKSKQYYEDNKPEILIKVKGYRKTHKAQRNAHERDRLANDPQYKITVNIRKRLNKLAKRGFKAGNSTDWGCTKQELQNWIEATCWPGMTWDNYGGRKYDNWVLDHIIPLASFDLTDREQFLIANHYTNLQALWADDNAFKRDRPDWSPSESKHELPERFKTTPTSAV